MKSYRFRSTRYSYSSFYPSDFSQGEGYSRKIKKTDYCKSKFISDTTFRHLLRKKWINLTYFKGRVWVEEKCPELIKDYLMVS